MLLIGILLASVLVLLAIESVGYSRGGYNGDFWKLPLDDKLDHVAKHDRDWWWVGSWSLVGIFLLTGGLAALAYLLADAGEPVLAFVGLGIFLVAMIAWIFGLLFQTAGVSQAAKQRQETGETPSWIHPLWYAGYLSETAWVVGANIAGNPQHRASARLGGLDGHCPRRADPSRGGHHQGRFPPTRRFGSVRDRSSSHHRSGIGRRLFG